MKQLPSGSGGGLQEQFDCLVQALAMSTFALKLKWFGVGEPSDRGSGSDGGGGDGGNNKEKRGGEGEGRRPGKERNIAADVWNGVSGTSRKDDKLKLNKRVGGCRRYNSSSVNVLQQQQQQQCGARDSRPEVLHVACVVYCVEFCRLTGRQVGRTIRADWKTKERRQIEITAGGLCMYEYNAVRMPYARGYSVTFVRCKEAS